MRRHMTESSQVGDEGAKNHQAPRLDQEYRALLQTLGVTCLS